ncbi:hypothetical protein C1H46_041982 [Malus baccata]|uniref:Uncharacterized protein n=1 Tax=Malus baccata TaxID=106549 RepID=A0A540KE29_MALBA|nr:hypothetical protein C1H46_041982 [Malus baccata]
MDSPALGGVALDRVAMPLSLYSGALAGVATMFVPQDTLSDLNKDTIRSYKSWSSYKLGIGVRRK